MPQKIVALKSCQCPRTTEIGEKLTEADPVYNGASEQAKDRLEQRGDCREVSWVMDILAAEHRQGFISANDAC